MQVHSYFGRLLSQNMLSESYEHAIKGHFVIGQIGGLKSKAVTKGLEAG